MYHKECCAVVCCTLRCYGMADEGCGDSEWRTGEGHIVRWVLKEEKDFSQVSV